METGSVLKKARNGRERVTEENVDDCSIDVLRATNGVRIEVY